MITWHYLWYKTRQHLLVKLGDPTMNLLTNGFLSSMCASHSFLTVIQVSDRGLRSPQQPLSVQEFSGFQGDSGLLSSLWQSGFTMTKFTRGGVWRESPKAERDSNSSPLKSPFCGVWGEETLSSFKSTLFVLSESWGFLRFDLSPLHNFFPHHCVML